MLWSVGGSTGEREPSLQKCIFSWSTNCGEWSIAFAGGTTQRFVFVYLGSTDRQIDLETTILASESWQSFTGENANLRSHAFPCRRTVDCPTGTGMVMCIDLPTRSLAWVTPYSSQGPDFSFSLNRRNQGVPYCDSWVDNSVTIAAGKALLTAPDSTQLNCFDLVDGKFIVVDAARRRSFSSPACAMAKSSWSARRVCKACNWADGHASLARIGDSLPSGRWIVQRHPLFSTDDR